MILRKTWTNVLATSARWWYRVRIIMWWCSVSRAVGNCTQVSGWLVPTSDRLCPCHMRLHLAWLQKLDGTSFWSSKCGDGGGLDDDDMLLVCDSEGLWASTSHELQQSGAEATGFLAV